MNRAAHEGWRVQSAYSAMERYQRAQLGSVCEQALEAARSVGEHSNGRLAGLEAGQREQRWRQLEAHAPSLVGTDKSRRSTEVITDQEQLRQAVHELAVANTTAADLRWQLQELSRSSQADLREQPQRWPEGAVQSPEKSRRNSQDIAELEGGAIRESPAELHERSQNSPSSLRALPISRFGLATVVSSETLDQVESPNRTIQNLLPSRERRSRVASDASSSQSQAFSDPDEPNHPNRKHPPPEPIHSPASPPRSPPPSPRTSPDRIRALMISPEPRRSPQRGDSLVSPLCSDTEPDACSPRRVSSPSSSVTAALAEAIRQARHVPSSPKADDSFSTGDQLEYMGSSAGESDGSNVSHMASSELARQGAVEWVQTESEKRALRGKWNATEESTTTKVVPSSSPNSAFFFAPSPGPKRPPPPLPSAPLSSALPKRRLGYTSVESWLLSPYSGGDSYGGASRREQALHEPGPPRYLGETQPHTESPAELRRSYAGASRQHAEALALASQAEALALVAYAEARAAAEVQVETSSRWQELELRSQLEGEHGGGAAEHYSAGHRQPPAEAYGRPIGERYIGEAEPHASRHYVAAEMTAPRSSRGNSHPHGWASDHGRASEIPRWPKLFLSSSILTADADSPARSGSESYGASCREEEEEARYSYGQQEHRDPPTPGAHRHSAVTAVEQPPQHIQQAGPSSTQHGMGVGYWRQGGTGTGMRIMDGASWRSDQAAVVATAVRPWSVTGGGAGRLPSWPRMWA